jgi:hypothetical protein
VKLTPLEIADRGVLFGQALAYSKTTLSAFALKNNATIEQVLSGLVCDSAETAHLSYRIGEFIGAFLFDLAMGGKCPQ